MLVGCDQRSGQSSPDRRQLSPRVRPHAALHTRGSSRRRRVPRRPSHRLSPEPGRHRPRELSLGRGRRHRRRDTGRRSAFAAGRWRRRRRHTDLPAAERARRERLREAAGGVTSFATDAAVTVAAFALNGRLFVAGLISGAARELAVAGPVFDPRPDPTARRVAYVCGRQLCCGRLDGRRRVAAGQDDESETISWGSAEFVAAQEMGRHGGYWWSPDGERLAVARVDIRAGGAVVHRRPAAPDAAMNSATRPPARRTPTYHSTSSCSWRIGRRHGMGPRRIRVPDRRPLGRRRAPPSRCSLVTNAEWYCGPSMSPPAPPPNGGATKTTTGWS